MSFGHLASFKIKFAAGAESCLEVKQSRQFYVIKQDGISNNK